MPDTDFDAFAQASDTLFATVRSTRGRIAAAEGLSSSQARLMEPLADHAPVPVGRLATLAGVAVPTATRMLQDLERRGMVARRRAAHSERVVEVDLTDTGRAALDHEQRRLRERQRRTYDSLTRRERALAYSLMAKLTELAGDL
jgi:DNA-binding MarR family transcriptional regulator